MLASGLDGQAEIPEDIGFEIDGKHRLPEAGVEGQEPVAEALIVMRRRGRHGYEDHPEAVKRETLHRGEGELPQPGEVLYRLHFLLRMNIQQTARGRAIDSPGLGPEAEALLLGVAARLDVDDDVVDFRQRMLDGSLDLGGDGMGRSDGKIGLHLDVEVDDEERAQPAYPRPMRVAGPRDRGDGREYLPVGAVSSVPSMSSVLASRKMPAATLIIQRETRRAVTRSRTGIRRTKVKPRPASTEQDTRTSLRRFLPLAISMELLAFLP